MFTLGLLGQCPKPHWIGDGACDDLTNIAECDFDGNDCCQDNSDFSFCQICACLDVTTTTVNEGSTANTTDSMTAKVTTELDSTFESTTTDKDAGNSTIKSQTNPETTSTDLQTTSEPTNE